MQYIKNRLSIVDSLFLIYFDTMKVSILLSIAPLTLTLGKICLGIMLDRAGCKKSTILGISMQVASSILLIVTYIILRNGGKAAKVIAFVAVR